MTCHLDLDHVDSRASSKSCVIGRIVVTDELPRKQRIEKVHQIVTTFCGAKEKWDRELFKSIHTERMPYDVFQFEWRDAQVTSNIRITGDRELIVQAFPNRIKPILSSSTISLSVGLKSEEVTTQWSFENMRLDDQPMIALFNSTSFKGYREVCVPLQFARSMKKIDRSPSKL